MRVLLLYISYKCILINFHAYIQNAILEEMRAYCTFKDVLINILVLLYDIDHDFIFNL